MIILAGAVRPVAGYVNPDFTPRELVGQSEWIAAAQVDISDAEGGGTLSWRVVRTYKGTPEEEVFHLEVDDVTADTLQESIDSSVKVIDALIFRGSYENASVDGGNLAGAWMHLGVDWIQLEEGADPGRWRIVDVDDPDFAAIWYGSTDMLMNAVEYALSHPDPCFPVSGAAAWGEGIHVAALEEGASDLQALRFRNEGLPHLFAASSGGDRLWQWDEGSGRYLERTAEWNVSSASRRAVWADFTGNRRIDLLAWDGDKLVLWHRGSDGAFAADPLLTLATEQTVLGLQSVDAAAWGEQAAGPAAALLSTAAGPFLFLLEREDGSPRLSPVFDDWQQMHGDELGRPLSGIAADFTGDGVADLFHPFTRGALFFKGLAGQGLQQASRIEGFFGSADYDAVFTGDFNASGLPDIYSISMFGSQLWENHGDGRFKNMIAGTGEVAYIPRPYAAGGVAGDINNNGRQDVILFYPSDAPMPFFSRGFRTFGYAFDMEIADRALQESSRGQVAWVLNDLTGSGTADLAMVLRDGGLWVVPVTLPEGLSRHAMQILAPETADMAGAINVSVYLDGYLLGTQPVRAGDAGAFFGLETVGDVRLRWTMPDGTERETEILKEDIPREYMLY